MDRKTSPKHRARPTILTNHRERVEESRHHDFSALGLDKPWEHRGMHVAVPVVHPHYDGRVDR